MIHSVSYLGYEAEIRENDGVRFAMLDIDGNTVLAFGETDEQIQAEFEFLIEGIMAVDRGDAYLDESGPYGGFMVAEAKRTREPS